MNPIKALTDYLKSSISELKKVTWPSRQETIRYTVLVSAVSLSVAVFFASLDFGLGKLVDATLLRPKSAPVEQQVPEPSFIPELESVDADGNVNVNVSDESGNFLPVDVGTDQTKNPL